MVRRASPMLAAILAVACVSGCGAAHPTSAAASGGAAAELPPAGDDGDEGASAGPSSDRPLTAAQLARIPKFAAPPTPEPVTVPAGPSAGWYSAIPTTQPVAFITIDDGWVKAPQAAQLLRAAHVPVTLFLEINAIRADPGYFQPLEQAGAVIEAHTITHVDLKGKPYAQQKQEICGSADRLGQLYGRRPVLFRPPFGDEDATTLRAVHDCNLKAAFFWKETTDKGIVRYQEGPQRQGRRHHPDALPARLRRGLPGRAAGDLRRRPDSGAAGELHQRPAGGGSVA